MSAASLPFEIPAQSRRLAMRLHSAPGLLRRLLEPGDTLDVRVRAVIALLILLAVAVADWYTGYEIAFSTMYLVPIAGTAWFVRPRFGTIMAVGAAALWFGINFPAERGSTWLVTGWNLSMRVVMFVFVAAVVGSARELLDAERLRSRTDDLTGALNVRAFYEIMKRELDRARRFVRPISVAYIDLDDFKEVNDRFGHAAGDEVLRGFARSIQHTLRSIDTVARVGGDEFIVLMPETDTEGAIGAVGRFTECAASIEGIRVGISIGIITCTEPIPANIDEIIHRADTLMYTAKRLGKNRYIQGRFSDVIATLPTRQDADRDEENREEQLESRPDPDPRATRVH